MMFQMITSIVDRVKAFYWLIMYKIGSVMSGKWMDLG